MSRAVTYCLLAALMTMIVLAWVSGYEIGKSSVARSTKPAAQLKGDTFDPNQLGDNVTKLERRPTTQKLMAQIDTLQRQLQDAQRKEATERRNAFAIRFPDVAKQLMDANIYASCDVVEEKISISFSHDLSSIERLIWYVGGTRSNARLEYHLSGPSRNQQLGGRVTFSEDPDDMPRRDPVIATRHGTVEECVAMMVANVNAVREAAERRRQK